MTDIEIADQPDRKRFEAHVGGALAGWAEYQLTDELMVFTHTEVDPAYEGQGVGSALARAALDEVRARGVKALVVCPFITSWIGRHREYADLLYGARPSTVTD
ncbi:N-acetyltransferase [Nocardioides carbamazepini]|uniref:GNAT family N-acetyltransferase n=1 Tax=Nocardioides carbamazepini TaxID=2854259 RepID=UPI00355905C9|nr:N-acetyltransferase [Nocardioides carbamazepini]